MKQKITQVHDEPILANPSFGEHRSAKVAADQSRRRFVKFNLLGLALAPTAGLFVGNNAWARNEPKKGIEPAPPAVLDPADRQAKALNYTKHSHKDGQSCSNCALYTGTDGEKIGPCAIFSYRVSPEGGQLMVDATGWCRSWAPRQPV
jgi:hypothetical protein